MLARGRHQYYYAQRRHSAVFGSSGATLLLGAEPDGVALDFRDLSVTVKDTATPANNFTGDVNSWLTYTSPSTKWVLGSNGLYSSGTALRTEYNSSGTALGVRIEEGRTNLCLHSNDLTQAAWTASNMTSAKTATGPDGVANSASTITATAGNATALQSITSGSAARITSVFLKRRTGTGNVDVTQDNGTTWATQSLTTSWARYSIASVTSTNPIVGIRLVTSGDAVDVAYFQHSLGSFATSPIVTAASTVARAADNISALTTLFPFNGATTTLFAEAYNPQITLSSGRLAMMGTASLLERHVELFFSNSTTQISGYGGAGTYFQVIGTTASQPARAAMALAANDGAAAVQGTLSAADATVTVGQAPARLYVGQLSNGTTHLNSHLSRLMVLPRRMSDAELQAITT